MYWLAYLSASISLAPIADVRVGEQGEKVRIEVLCTQQCDAEPIDETTFLITWARGDFIANVSQRTRFVKTVSVQTQDYGASFHIEPVRPPRAVVVNRCGVARLCFDFDFSARAPKPADQPTLAALEDDLNALMQTVGYRRGAPKPGLFASIPGTRPIAISAEPVAQVHKRRDHKPATPVAAPPDSPSPSPASVEPVDTRATCQAAKAALEADAWNLGAYQTVAICKATQSEHAVAERYLVRLQAYAESSAGSSLQSALR